MPPNMRPLVPSDAPPPPPIPVGGSSHRFQPFQGCNQRIDRRCGCVKSLDDRCRDGRLSPSTRPGEHDQCRFQGSDGVGVPPFAVRMMKSWPHSSANFFVMVSAICLSLAFSCKALMSIRPLTDSSMIGAEFLDD